jgi:translation initiation factor IF-2
MSEDNEKKPTLGRKPLGLKRSVESGEVKQTFSHGRTNKVVVEVKRRKLVGKPGAAPAPAPVEAEKPAPAPAPDPAPELADEARVAPKPKAGSVLSRKEMQEKLLREAEEARINMMEEAGRRETEEKQKAAEEERKRAEKKREVASDKADDEAAASTAAETVDEVPAEDTSAVEMSPDVPLDDISAKSPAPRRFTPVPTPPRPETKPKAPKGSPKAGDNRRQSGKLTVSRALNEGDGGARARSLAALKRAREKEKRAHMQGKGQPREAQPKQIRDVVVPDAITVQELANRMAEKGADLVKSLFNMGSMVTVNQTIDHDTAELLVEEFGHRIKRVSEADVEVGIETEADAEDTLKPRPPVVTIMGHVDHGKTSLLDALRGTDVVAGEAGGITQHMGAYQIKVKTGEKITFLDTPGHAAFTEMRARGANVTDIVILVVAADDGLMPQTIEAINHTKAAGVPMIVAINKIDKDGANAQKVRERLLEHEVIVEAMSGDVQDVEVSALKKINLEGLVEKINLQAELLDLKANPDRAAEGVVVESKLDKGRGPVATVLIERGTLRRGDVFVVGEHSGKVRALINDKGQQIKEAGPSLPVEVLGLSGVPGAGDKLTVVENDARAREVATYRSETARKKRTAMAPASLDTMFSSLAADRAMEYPVIIKGDVHGSVEAIIGSLAKISTEDINARVLHSGVGAITESDVTLAKASNAPIIGFNVRANAKARENAQREGVRFKYFDIIYDLIEDIKGEMAGKLGPERLETVVGRAEVKDVFSAGKKGKAAGLLVTDGFLKKDLAARITRDDVIIYNGKIDSLRRFKDDVPEVRAGLECGVVFENTTDLKPGDYVETFEVEMRERTL